MKTVTINAKLKPFAIDSYRYYVAYGGRGSAKSWSIARILLLLAMQSKLRILCTREIQDSIKDSVHKLLKDQIDLLELEGFIVQNDTIKHVNGSEFLFTGLYRNITKIKSMEAIDICWIEEAESISAMSFEVLDPTIRKPNSKIFISFNPRYEDDIIYKNFVLNKPDNAYVVKVNWNDNKYFPKELEDQRVHMFRTDPDLALHIWEGELKRNTAEQIMQNKWSVDTFESDPESTHYYFGADWGFSQDPNTLVRCFIGEHLSYGSNCLFIEYEACDRPYNEDKRNTSSDLDELPSLWKKVPLVEKYTVEADSARPETISYMKKQGFKVRGVDKWSGSVEDGITYLRSFDKIIIHSRCVNTIFEFKHYKYKVDVRSGQITDKIIDANNHLIDALRYAINSLIKNRGGSVFGSLRKKSS